MNLFGILFICFVSILPLHAMADDCVTTSIIGHFPSEPTPAPSPNIFDEPSEESPRQWVEETPAVDPGAFPDLNLPVEREATIAANAAQRTPAVGRKPAALPISSPRSSDGAGALR